MGKHKANHAFTFIIAIQMSQEQPRNNVESLDKTTGMSDQMMRHTG